MVIFADQILFLVTPHWHFIELGVSLLFYYYPIRRRFKFQNSCAQNMPVSHIHKINLNVLKNLLQMMMQAVFSLGRYLNSWRISIVTNQVDKQRVHMLCE